MRKILILAVFNLTVYAQAFSQSQITEANGNVGIGTTTPSAKLTVNGDIKAETYVRAGTMPASPNGQFRVIGQQGISAVEASTNKTVFLYSGEGDYGIGAYDYSALTPIPLTVGFYNVNTYINRNGGGVGIGTTNIPSGYKLAIGGNIIAEKMKVQLQGSWPDYVFSTNYILRPVSEVEEYIKQYKHLPEVPSASEVEKNGLDVGENQALLLKKIEELTLYLIELKKDNENTKRVNDVKIKKLEEANEMLKDKISCLEASQ